MQVFLSVIFLLIGIAVVVLAVVYQTLDKFRFYGRRQWPAIEPLVDEWIDSAAADCSNLPGFGEALEEYENARQPERKAAAFMLLAELCEKSVERREIEYHITEETGRYNEYVRQYNKRFDKAFYGRVGSLLRFRRMTPIEFES